MDDLIAFLRARLDDDERAARAAKPGPWRWAREQPHTTLLVGSQPWSAEFGHDVVVPIADGERYPSRFDADHIVRHDPSRALAEVAAKRRILNAYLDERSRRDIYESDDARAAEDEKQAMRRRSAAARCRGLEIAVQLLALPFADHPDYREEWRP